MTTPGDPLATLNDAINNYVIAHDAMKEAAQQLTTTEPNATGEPRTLPPRIRDAIFTQP